MSRPDTISNHSTHLVEMQPSAKLGQDFSEPGASKSLKTSLPVRKPVQWKDLDFSIGLCFCSQDEEETVVFER
ncbi:hypothetical protein TNCV_4777221 [Trichonephila clavipes]|nr:hypothetical protein TNCV_4777221 [Trichonephila clavipes]